MKTMLAAILLCFFVTGCSSSYVITSTSPSVGDDVKSPLTYTATVLEFNEFAEGKEAEVVLNNDVVIPATDLYLSADSLHWFSPETKLKTGVVKSEVREVNFSNNLFGDLGEGGLEGAKIGFLSGAVAGLLLAEIIIATEPAEEGEGLYYIIVPAIGGVGGALIGFPIGVIIGLIFGHTYDYEFQTTEQEKINN